MPRPQKRRRICGMPGHCRFGPQGGCAAACEVVMTLDEYECIRLIDLLGYTQEKCARQMGVARTTVQAVYDRARKKLAEALVQGKELVISGGEYWVCPHSEGCGKKKCWKQQQETGRCPACGALTEEKEHTEP